MTGRLERGTLVGDYEVVRRLAAGGMGEVYEAVHPVIGKRAAIKVLRGSHADSLSEARRLLEEARAVNAIRHPGIVDIFGAAVLPDGRPCLIMELLEGTTLKEHLKEKGPLPLPEVFEVLAGILEPLAAAHRAGVIHRDLKTSNVVLERTAVGRRVRLLDFGIARRVERSDALTHPEMTLGSLGFMGPEQLAGEPVLQSDLYALGCVAWLLIAGRPVFVGESPAVLVALHVGRAPPPLRKYRKDAPPELEAWVRWLLEKRPEDRPFSAEVALATLREAEVLALGEQTVGVGVDFMAEARRLDAKARRAAGPTRAPPTVLEVPLPEATTERVATLRGPRPDTAAATRPEGHRAQPASRHEAATRLRPPTKRR